MNNEKAADEAYTAWLDHADDAYEAAHGRGITGEAGEALETALFTLSEYCEVVEPEGGPVTKAVVKLVDAVCDYEDLPTELLAMNGLLEPVTDYDGLAGYDPNTPPRPIHL